MLIPYRGQKVNWLPGTKVPGNISFLGAKVPGLSFLVAKVPTPSLRGAKVPGSEKSWYRGSTGKFSNFSTWQRPPYFLLDSVSLCFCRKHGRGTLAAWDMKGPNSTTGLERAISNADKDYLSISPVIESVELTIHCDRLISEFGRCV